MSERPEKRLRQTQAPTKYYESEDSEEWNSPPRKTAAKKGHESHNQGAATSRSRRNASGSQSVTVEKQLSSPTDEAKKSIHLTVKMPSTKLREATSGGKNAVNLGLRETFEPEDVVKGPRGSRAKRNIVEDSDSEEEDELELDDEEEEEGEEEEEEEVDSASEDADAEGDIDMEDLPPPPIIKAKAGPPGTKPTLKVTPAKVGKVKSVEAKEMGVDDDDEELSELDSEEDEDGLGRGDEDAEGEEDDVEDIEMGDEGVELEDDEQDEEEEDSDDEDATPASGSRGSTPDISKMTKRQRSRVEQVIGGDLLELPAESKAKKMLTAEEHAMRRAEMARRRKNLSEKRNEEEKMDTINKLLKKQAPKRRGRAAAGDLAGDATPNTQDIEFEKPNPIVIRWVNNAQGSRIGVPEEWLDTPIGKVFGPAPTGQRKLVEENDTT